MRLAYRLHFFVRISWRMAIERDDDCLAETHAPLSAGNDLGLRTVRMSIEDDGRCETLRRLPC